MTRIVWMLVFLAALAVQLPAQKKPDPKPESAPASQPAIPIDAELQKELDSMAAELSVKMNCVPGKTFDLAGTINPSQLTVLMEVADRAFKMFEDITAGAGGVAGPSSTGSAPRPAGQTPANVLFDGRKCLIVIFNSTQQYNAFSKWYQTKYSWPVVDAMKTVNYFTIAYPRCTIASHLRPLDINMMRNVVAHEIGHMCAYRYAYNNNFSPVWFVEGLATCMEGKTLGTTSCYCFSGGYGDANAQNKNLVNREWSKWKAAVKTLAKQKQDKSIDHILPMQLNELSMNETGKAMAMVDFWINTDPVKLVNWLALTKKYWPQKPQYEWEPAKGDAQKRALKEAWNMEWAELDEAWRKYVQASY
jgi:hypothetical protein